MIQREEKFIQQGILGSGINSLAGELALCLKKIRELFERLYQITSSALKSTLASMAGVSSRTYHATRSAWGSMGQQINNGLKGFSNFMRTPAGRYLAVGVVVVGVVGIGWFAYKGYAEYRESKIEETLLQGKLESTLRQEMDSLVKKVMELSKDPSQLHQYFTSGEFIRELLAISNIQKEDIQRVKSDVKEQLKLFREFGYGKEMEWDWLV